MAIIDWPTTDAFRPTLPYSFGVSTPKSGARGFYTGESESTGHLADRLVTSITLPPCSGAEAAARSALLMGAMSRGDRFRFRCFHQPQNSGVLRGSPTVATSAIAGARSLTLANGRAGNNLLRSADLMSTTLSAGWFLNNSTITANSVTDPIGTTTGWTLNLTPGGNHFAFSTLTLASTALRTVSAYVWLKAGTLSGNVVLRIRDGLDAEVGNATVTPTGTWAVYRVAATFGGASAANVRFYIDPVNDAGTGGDTLQVWFSEVRVMSGYDTLCTTEAEAISPPDGSPVLADQVTCTTVGNRFTSWIYTTAEHANQTFTASVWLRAGTFSGDVVLFMRDGGGATVASAVANIDGTWRRFQLTGTFGPTPASNVVFIVDPNAVGVVGDVHYRYGVMLEPGGAATTFEPWPTALGGDVVSVGGNLLMVDYQGATGDVTGAITLPLVLPLARPVSGGAVVTTAAPTGTWQLDTNDGINFDFSAPVVQMGVTIPFRQVIV